MGEDKRYVKYTGRSQLTPHVSPGLPPSVDTLPTELAVVCAVAQLEVCLRTCNHALHCSNTLIKRGLTTGSMIISNDQSEELVGWLFLYSVPALWTAAEQSNGGLPFTCPQTAEGAW